jgi:hypothetical protein
LTSRQLLAVDTAISLGAASRIASCLAVAREFLMAPFGDGQHLNFDRYHRLRREGSGERQLDGRVGRSARKRHPSVDPEREACAVAYMGNMPSECRGCAQAMAASR